MMMVWALFLGGKVLLLMRIMKMMMIPEPNFNLQMNTTLRTMRESLANQVYQEDQHQVPSIFSQALRIKRLKSISFLRSWQSTSLYYTCLTNVSSYTMSTHHS
ncbi:unnamed protein product [Brassica napus]|uniref:(rape) hypothetical protein n=1 Tax=Brassica napus TaxID=3708 RepID=A0A816UR40_BRANA|nr:unnamed protein product [Brassica napus]